MANELCAAMQAKIEEQIDRTLHLTAMLPAEPPEHVCALLGHLLDCFAGFCAVLAAAEPARLAHLAALKELPVNHRCSAEEGRQRIAIFARAIAAGFDEMDDRALARRIPTVFVPKGEPLLTLLLGNLEHVINHKHQLFLEVRALGARVSSSDLYAFRS